MFIVQACRADTTVPQQSFLNHLAKSFKSLCGTPKTDSKAESKSSAADFIRVMAAAPGEKAYRNVFIPLFIEQLERGLDLLEAIAETSYRVDRSTVTDEHRTLRKTLHLQGKK